MATPLPSRVTGRALVEALLAGVLVGLVGALVLGGVAVVDPRGRWSALAVRAPRAELIVFPLGHVAVLALAEAIPLRLRSVEVAHLWRFLAGAAAPVVGFAASFAATAALEGTPPWVALVSAVSWPGFTFASVTILALVAFVCGLSEGLASGVRPALVRRRPLLALAQLLGLGRVHAPRRRHLGVSTALTVLGLGFFLWLGELAEASPTTERVPFYALVAALSHGIAIGPARRRARALLAGAGLA